MFGGTTVVDDIVEVMRSSHDLKRECFRHRSDLNRRVLSIYLASAARVTKVAAIADYGSSVIRVSGTGIPGQRRHSSWCLERLLSVIQGPTDDYRQRSASRALQL